MKGIYHVHMPTTSGFAVTMCMSTGLQLHHDNTPIEAGAPGPLFPLQGHPKIMEGNKSSCVAYKVNMDEFQRLSL
jgi:hypothetical protein